MRAIAAFAPSKMFFTRPTGFPERSESACTIPSPGFGTILIDSVAAATTPVAAMATARRARRIGIENDGISGSFAADSTSGPEPGDGYNGDETLEMVEERAIRAAVRRYDGNLSLVAKSLDISRPTLYSKLKKYNI